MAGVIRERLTTATSDGVKVAVHRHGDGPPLYVIHGGPGSDHQGFVPYLDAIGALRSAAAREVVVATPRSWGFQRLLMNSFL